MINTACVAALSFPFPNAREREENCERVAKSPLLPNFVAHPRRGPSFARFSLAGSISAQPKKGKESAATQAMINKVKKVQKTHKLTCNQNSVCKE